MFKLKLSGKIVIFNLLSQLFAKKGGLSYVTHREKAH